MAKILLTFIGTGKYEEAIYYFRDNSYRTKYIQEALVNIFDNDIDKVILVGTEKSREAHFNDIKEKINKKSIDELIIKNGFNEEEFKENFKMIYEKINEGDEIIFDITHSYRSIPLFVVTLGFYLKVLKNIKINKILYGAFEKIYEDNPGKNTTKEIEIDNRKAPIVDATYVFTIFDWTISTNFFIETGNSFKLEKITKNILGKQLNSDIPAQSINAYISKLSKLNQIITTCRIGGPESAYNLNKIVKELNQPKYKVTSDFNDSLIDSLIQKIRQEFEFDEVNKYQKVLDYCVKYNYIQQGYTVLEELIPTVLLEKIGEKQKLNDKDTREKINNYLYGLIKPEQKKEINQDLTKKLNDLSDKYNNQLIQLANLLQNIQDFRNDINHAGYRETNFHGYTGIKNKLTEYINNFNKIFSDLH